MQHLLLFLSNRGYANAHQGSIMGLLRVLHLSSKNTRFFNLISTVNNAGPSSAVLNLLTFWRRNYFFKF